jgi:hypothetical protein
VACAHCGFVRYLFSTRKFTNDSCEITLVEYLSRLQLFGHEIVAVLCGLVWGLWVGFAIVSAGTFLGEVGNF